MGALIIIDVDARCNIPTYDSSLDNFIMKSIITKSLTKIKYDFIDSKKNIIISTIDTYRNFIPT